MIKITYDKKEVVIIDVLSSFMESYINIHAVIEWAHILLQHVYLYVSFNRLKLVNTV